MGLDFSLESPYCKHQLYSGNITHNLGAMADEAGIYECLWRPDEHGYERAGQIIPLLTDGVRRMVSDPARFKQHNPSNGWGTYKDFKRFVEEVLAACSENPEAKIRVSR